MCTIAGITYLATQKNQKARDDRDIEQERENALNNDFFSQAVADISAEKRKKKGGLFSDSWNV